MVERIVIIGAGQAAGRAAEAMRASDATVEMCLIGAEPHPPYERPPLSKEALHSGSNAPVPPIHPPAWYDAQHIRCYFSQTVQAIERTQRRVVLDREAIPYDRLLIATGSRPRRLTIPGSELAGVHYLRGIEDSAAIAHTIRSAHHITVIGGGFIGLEVASSARKQGVVVRVLEAGTRLMGRAGPPELAHWISQRYLDAGITIQCQAQAERIIGESGQVSAIRLQNGEQFATQAVVVGIGITPCVELAENAGLAVDNGILADAYCRTSDAMIFCAGDVANRFDPGLRRHIRFESWENAQNQAIAAAGFLLGASTPYQAKPWFWSDQLDFRLEITGAPIDWHDMVWRGDPAPGSVSFIGFRKQDAVITGVIAMQAGREAPIARRLLGKTVSSERLADPNVGLRRLL